jgi:hypothetical protein
MIETTSEYRLNVYNDEREFKSRIKISMNGEEKEYGDETVIRMNILEEMNKLNESLPSNELSLTLDNSSGEFSFLNLSNMDQILSSKPTIETELGVVIIDSQYETVSTDLFDKVAGRTTENMNKVFRYGRSTLATPSELTQELTQLQYNLIASLDMESTGGSVNINNYFMQATFHLNIIDAYQKAYGDKVWQGATTTAEKIELAKSYTDTLTGFIIGYANAPNSTKGSFSVWNFRTNTWSAPYESYVDFEATFDMTLHGDLSDYIDSQGYLVFTFYSEKSNGSAAANLILEYAGLDVRTNGFKIAEFVPTGKFFITEWQNDVTNKVITFTGHDYLTLLSEITFTPSSATTLSAIATDVFNQANVPTADRNVNATALNITVNRLLETTDCRTVLQWIGMVSKCAVWQDRYGVINIQPMSTLRDKTGYANYVTTQPTLFGYPSIKNDYVEGAPPPGPGDPIQGATEPIQYTTTLLETTGSGMRYLDFDQMYEHPKVTLDKSIYQLVVKVYASAGAEPTDSIYTNPNLVGNNGQTFTIDNPLVNSTTIASDIANWYFTESQYNAIYDLRWRQNPILEGGDVVLIEDSFQALKRSQIIKQEFIYEGYLEGRTTAKGGL